MDYVTDIDATLHFGRAATVDNADDACGTVASFLSRDTESVQRCHTGTGATVRYDATLSTGQYRYPVCTRFSAI